MNRLFFYKTAVFLVVILLAGSGTSQTVWDRDVLATYKNGCVTRQEVFKWLVAQDSADEKRRRKTDIKTHIRRIVLDRLALEEARTHAYDQKPDTVLVLKTARSEYYSEALVNDLQKTPYCDEIARVRIIRLAVKNYRLNGYKKVALSQREMKNEVKKRKKEALHLISKLTCGAEFSKIAKQYSDDHSRSVGGDIGFIAKGMRGNLFSQRVFSLKKADITKSPLRLGNDIYIIKLEEIKKVTHDTLPDVVKNVDLADKLKKAYYKRKKERLIQKLAENSNVAYYPDQILSKDEAAVLFRIHDRVFKKHELTQFIDFSIRNRGGGRSGPCRRDAEIKLLKRLFENELLEQEALKRGYAKDPALSYKWKLRRNNIIVNGYIRDIVYQGIDVTPKEARDFYTKNRSNYMVLAAKKNASAYIPFETVHASIRYKIKTRKQALKRSTWEDDLLKQNKLSINEGHPEPKDPHGSLLQAF